MKKEEIEKGTKIWLKNKLKKSQKIYYGNQFIKSKNFKSIIHWNTLCIRKFNTRKRRGVQITCGKCNIRRWVVFDNIIKQLKKPYFTGLCKSCIESLTWLERGRPRPKRRKIIPGTGYVKVYDPENPMADKRGEIYEHRLVMSQILNRPLKRWEHVHHKDNNRANNSPENLELVTTQQNQSLKDMNIRIKYLENILMSHGIKF